jgi:ABC-type polysaccharide/polyol phosphate export permease
VLFPAEVLPIVSVLANMVHFGLGLIILAGFMVGTRHYPDASLLVWFPIVVGVQLVFTLALALILAALTVHFRDIRDLLSNLLTFWFFATPIIYSIQSMPELKLFFDLNPFTHLAVSYQEILFFSDNAFGHVYWLLATAVLSVGVFLFGYWVFDRLRDSFAEAV